MNTCKITLFSGRKVPCSREAADLAVAFDIVKRYPKAAARILPSVDAFQKSAVMLQEYEKEMGLTRLNEALEKNLTLPAT